MDRQEPAKDFHMEVSKEFSGERLDKFIVANDLGLSRSQVQRLITGGNVSINSSGITVSSRRVRYGDSVTVRIPPPRSLTIVPVPMPLNIIHEDRHLIVLDKPPGLVVHPGAGNFEHTLVHGLLHHCQDLSGIGGCLRPGIVHRLDKDTSGLMVAAKNDAAHTGLAEEFKAGSVIKEYNALVRGRLPDLTGRIDRPIGRHPVHRIKMSAGIDSGKRALTDWRVIKEFPGTTLVSLKIHTGRTHQIRVHMSSVGHPLLGDALYGGPGQVRLADRAVTIPRQMLHSVFLEFTHPVSGQRMKWKSRLPEDMINVIEKLTRACS